LIEFLMDGIAILTMKRSKTHKKIDIEMTIKLSHLLNS